MYKNYYDKNMLINNNNNNFISKNINNIYNPISFNDVINNKHENIHNILYTTALNRYIVGKLSDIHYSTYNSYSYILSYSFTTTYDFITKEYGEIDETEFNDKFNKHYSDIYNDSYNSYIYNIYNSYNTEEYISYIKNSYKFIEINNNNNYLLPTYVLSINKHYPFTKEKINLSYDWHNIKYWNNNYMIAQQNSYENIKYINSEELLTLSEIEYYDYINERVQLGNRFDNNKIYIKFSDLNDKIKPNKYLFYKNHK